MGTKKEVLSYSTNPYIATGIEIQWLSAPDWRERYAMQAYPDGRLTGWNAWRTHGARPL